MTFYLTKKLKMTFLNEYTVQYCQYSIQKMFVRRNSTKYKLAHRHIAACIKTEKTVYRLSEN